MEVIEQKYNDSMVFSVTYAQVDDTPIDISSMTIQIQVIAKLRNTVMLTLGIGTGIDIIDAVNGQFNISVRDTSALVVGDYFIDTKYTDQEGYSISAESFILRIVERLT